MTRVTDPGVILPSETPIIEEEVSGEIQSEKNFEEEKMEENSEILEFIEEKKVCKTCNIVKPPRSSHCSKCNRCIENFDRILKIN
jgi:ribosomal protein L40E